MANSGGRIRRFSEKRRHSLTTGARVARILNEIWRAPPSGSGVIAVTEDGAIYQGRRLPEAFVWVPANEAVYTAFRNYRRIPTQRNRISALRRGAWWGHGLRPIPWLLAWSARQMA